MDIVERLTKKYKGEFSNSREGADMDNTKILLFDIETVPNLAWVWGKYEQNVIEFDKNWHMLCFAAKWLGKKKITTKGLYEFKRYKKDPENDYDVVKALWLLLDEADIVIAHNGDKFDIKKANARFLMHDMEPPSPYRTIDTLKVARRYFKFDSNKLDDLGEYLNLGRKVATGGWKLWRGCIQGDLTSWRKMIKYNKQDVVLLEEVYLKMRPWMVTHPNVNIVTGKEEACPICSSLNIQKRGFSVTRVGKYQRYQCQDCGGWSRGEAIKGGSLKIR